MKLSRLLPLVVGGAVAGMVVSSASPAQALSYTFSFDNVEASVAGTVSGTIELPDGDGTFAATSIIVNSAPGALGYTLPFDITTNFTGVAANSFTVLGGTIDPILSQFGAQSAAGTSALALNFPGVGSALNTQASGDFNIGVRDLSNSTLTYSSAATPVPFDTPAGQAMATVGSLFALGLMRKAKKRLAAKTLVVNPVETVVS